LTVATAAILAAGVVVASPGLAPSGQVRVSSTAVVLVSGVKPSVYEPPPIVVRTCATCEPITINQNVFTRYTGIRFEEAHSYTYTSNVSGPSVSHPVGLIPELLQDAKNPPILQAIFIKTLQGKTITLNVSDVSDFLVYANAAGAVVGQQVHTAVHDTVTPSQWGGGKVLTDWVNAAQVTGAMTIGIGAKVDDKWVPSIRVAAISARNQIANDILGTQTHPNYARDYTPQLDWETRATTPASPIRSVAHRKARTPTATHTAAASTARPAAMPAASRR